MSPPAPPRRLVAGSAALAALLLPLVAAPQAPLPETFQQIKVELIEGAAPGLDRAEIERRLGLYFADVSAIFAQQTRRRFVFDPRIDLTIYPTVADLPPFSFSGTDSTIRVILNPSGPGGISGSAASGARQIGGAVSVHGVTTLFDPENLATQQEVGQYLGNHLHTLVHELEHIYGAGGGEYYENRHVVDRTGVAPRVDLDHDEGYPQSTDPYWSQHREYDGDPLFTQQYMNASLGSPSDRQAVIAATRFTRGTRALVDGEWAVKPTASLTSPELAGRQAIELRLFDKLTGQPIAASGGSVKIWAFTQSLFGTASPYLTRSGAYDPAAGYVFSWPGNQGGFTWGENRLLIKAFVPGYVSAGAWHTSYDLVDQLIVEGRPSARFDLFLTPVGAPGPELALAAPANGKADAGQALPVTFRASAGQGVRKFQLAYESGLPACTRLFAPDTGRAAPVDVTCPVPVTGAVGSTMQVTATVTDEAGRSASQGASFAVVDESGPFLSLWPASGRSAVHPGEKLNAVLDFYDPSGVARAELFVGGSRVCARSLKPGEALTHLECAWSAPEVAGGMGQVPVRLVGWDARGQASEVTETVNVDGIAPTLAVLSPADGAVVRAGDELRVELRAADASGIDHVEVASSGQTLCYEFSRPQACSFTVPADFSGPKELSVEVHDLAGNRSRQVVWIQVVRP
ncbi:MAG: Ig-like domain-containing protein [Deltaproteobacteria bacterium]|nr:Ig-like domain-containing protein [Deltaproteobacteria bacterium]